MAKPHDIFNSEEQISLLDKSITASERATAFLGSFLTTLLSIYLFWQYLIR